MTLEYTSLNSYFKRCLILAVYHLVLSSQEALKVGVDKSQAEINVDFK